MTTAEDLRHRFAVLHDDDQADARLLRTGGPSGTSGGMNERVIRLEEWAKVSDARMARMETKLDALPSKTDMLTMFIATFAALGLILAGLAWLDGRANRYAVQNERPATPAPIIVQIPTPPPPPK